MDPRFPYGKIPESCSKWRKFKLGGSHIRYTAGISTWTLLFVVYINDLPDHVDSEAYLFAEDTKIFRIITGENDHNILQEDLQKMEDWSNNWLLKFHSEKCKYMNITRTTNEGNREYRLLDQNITKVNEEKDIGVTIDSLLSFKQHICEKVIKAN
jgi:hypothetical protein